MKIIAKGSFGILFFILIASNLFIFVSGYQLGEKINYYEQETKKIHLQNMELEKKMYQASSFTHIASEAAKLDFVNTAVPMYIEKLPFAKR